ncbi:hypothetical protein EON81_14125 [bacterium]|nr:MAG: hypothetical protein EON81_14125 [bacterium]
MLILPAPSFEMPLLDDLEKRAYTYFVEQTHPATGLTKDRASNLKTSDEYTVASSAATGFALVAFTIGADRKWGSRDDLLKRTKTTLRAINDILEHHNGWSFHFVDWSNGKRVWNSEASSIDTSILLAGVVVAREYWKDKEVTDLANRYRDRIDWKGMLTDGGKKPDAYHLSMGFVPEKGYIEGRWGNLYDECKMIYLQAYGLDREMTTAGWEKIDRKPVKYKGIELYVGGPLFMHQMSESFYPFRGMRDRMGIDYWVASRNAARGNREYCIDNPEGFKAYGPNFWGLSACDHPDGYNAFGAPGWIDDNGTITPTSAVATINHTPKEAESFALAMRKDHPDSWGRYGFPNGVNPTKAWNDPDVIGIDLGMMMCALANRNGFVQKLSMKAPEIQAGYRAVGFKKSPSAGEALRQGK